MLAPLERDPLQAHTKCAAQSFHGAREYHPALTCTAVDDGEFVRMGERFDGVQVRRVRPVALSEFLAAEILALGNGRGEQLA